MFNIIIYNVPIYPRIYNVPILAFLANNLVIPSLKSSQPSDILSILSAIVKSPIFVSSQNFCKFSKMDCIIVGASILPVVMKRHFEKPYFNLFFSTMSSILSIINNVWQRFAHFLNTICRKCMSPNVISLLYCSLFLRKNFSKMLLYSIFLKQ